VQLQIFEVGTRILVVCVGEIISHAGPRLSSHGELFGQTSPRERAVSARPTHLPTHRRGMMPHSCRATTRPPTPRWYRGRDDKVFKTPRGTCVGGRLSVPVSDRADDDTMEMFAADHTPLLVCPFVVGMIVD